MLSPDVTVEDFTPEDWVRLGRILSRPPAGGRKGGLIVVVEDDSVTKVVSTVRGRIAGHEIEYPPALPEIAARYDARFVLSVQRGALETAMDRWASRLDAGQSFTEQLLQLLSVFREMEDEGSVALFPRSFGSMKVVSERVVDVALDAICPVGKALVLGAFEGGEVATCIAVHRGESGFDRVVGPEQLRREMGLVSGDWTRDYRHLARAAELSVGSLSLGCFAETATWQRLASARAPGAWSSAVAVRDLVLHPVVPAVAIPLGIDVGRVALAAVRDLAGRVGSSWLFGTESPFSPALRRVRQMASGGELSGMLGFDPVSALIDFLEGNPGSEDAARSEDGGDSADASGPDASA